MAWRQLPFPPFSTCGDHCTEVRGMGPSRSAVQKGQRAACSLRLHIGSPQQSPQQGSHETHHFQHSLAPTPGMCRYAPCYARRQRWFLLETSQMTLVQSQLHPCHGASPLCLSFHFCKMGTVMLVLASYPEHAASSWHEPEKLLLC